MGAFTLLFLLSVTLVVAAVNPGSYLITNVQFTAQTVVGTDVAREGMPISTFNLEGDTSTNTIWSVDSTQTRLTVELLGLLAMTDATGGGAAGQGVFTVQAPNPQSPLVPIGTQSWEFIQASHGTIIALAGQDLAWTLATDALFTQITMQPIDSSDLRQQWTFTPHALE
ncbi:hypothetical protein SCHPADRAFT_604232 [Schizopora paradoxa]|uniref:Ricin B lectin domain-containing protein n=1 Tax=Schizopora paradoxa TaxID=27342 RepID=A0A0H2R9P4_9AGAM|nr:hypothetical protein SCHPADRAFT_604232 [Schizopora paradoxa]